MDSNIVRVLDWAESQGIVLEGIRPQISHGQGIGIFATRRIAAGECILQVPANMLRSAANTPKDMLAALPGAHAHAILATWLCLDSSEDKSIWALSFPSRSEMRSLMPICWPPRFQQLLPGRAQDILKGQRANFDRDWAAFSHAYPGRASRDEYLYHWLLVNTRSFYYQSGTNSKRRNMVLQPVADLFNHKPGEHCVAESSSRGFKFSTTREYARGEEIFVKYGSHSNDALLVDYGFVLPSQLNLFDEVDLAQYMLPQFSAAQRTLLQEREFLGKYALDSKSICHRTKTALKVHCISPDQWLDTADGHRDEDLDAEAVDALLQKLLRKVLRHVDEMKVLVDEASEESKQLGETIMERWRQIEELVKLELDRLAARHGTL